MLLGKVTEGKPDVVLPGEEVEDTIGEELLAMAGRASKARVAKATRCMVTFVALNAVHGINMVLGSIFESVRRTVVERFPALKEWW